MQGLSAVGRQGVWEKVRESLSMMGIPRRTQSHGGGLGTRRAGRYIEVPGQGQATNVWGNSIEVPGPLSQRSVHGEAGLGHLQGHSEELGCSSQSNGNPWEEVTQMV